MSDPDDYESDGATIDELTDDVREIRDRHEEVLDDLDLTTSTPDDIEAKKEELKRITRRREELERRIGEVAVRCVADGGDVRLVPPDEPEGEVGDPAGTGSGGDEPPGPGPPRHATDPSSHDVDPLGPDPERFHRRVSAGDADPGFVDDAREIFEAVGPPPRQLTAASAEDDLRGIYDGLDTNAMGRFPADVVHAASSLLAARAKRFNVQLDRTRVPNPGRLDTSHVFNSLTAFVSEFQKANEAGADLYVHGLGRDHDPVGSTWAEDAREWHEVLGSKLMWWSDYLSPEPEDDGGEAVEWDPDDLEAGMKEGAI